ncbi:hypothetical protein RND71_038215 [Anisodus tanguticus]|uniref:Uncharacterized protein n=1 Tax=Anisodus tanguticus TaxID=243964 RepID=A0AAE1UYY7_9SOLA|nr:hypothetical protein RND71_038215 [Anisodus tanguticus]
MNTIVKSPISRTQTPYCRVDLLKCTSSKGFAQCQSNYLGERQAKGIIINTYVELEPHPIKSLANDNGVPSIYPVGPIINLNQEPDESIDSWLDEQQDSSVLFLCFWSCGSFDEEQLKEIATALDRSGYRFLWALRQPQAKGEIVRQSDRMGTSSGGGVSRVNWRIHYALRLEFDTRKLVFGIPMATWPMYAEQQVNAFELVVDMEMAVDINMEYRSESLVLVTAEEIESAIRRLMFDSTEEKNIRKKKEKMKEKSRRAVLEGGSSYHFLESLIKDFKDHSSN